MQTNKKGLIGLNQLTGIIMLLVVIGVMIVVGLTVDTSLQENSDTVTISNTFENGTAVAVVTETGVNINMGAIVGGSVTTDEKRSCSLTVTEVSNQTSEQAPINAGNYTVTGCLISFSSLFSADNDGYNGTIWNVSGSITYQSDTTTYNASNGVIEGKANISAQQGLLGTIIIFGIIISVVVVAFMIRS